MRGHPSYSLRPVAVADREFLWYLHRATMKDYVDATWGWDEQFQRRMFDENLDPEKQRIVVVGGEDVGVISTERRGDALILYNIRVSPDHQRRGLGTRLVRDVLEEASREGLRVDLSVLKVNLEARRLYERLGFALVGETETHHLMSAAP
jgi:ribosomal protein S18 acetylase RimI-like enzyme